MTVASSLLFPFFFFNDTATTEIYTLSLHDALPILSDGQADAGGGRAPDAREPAGGEGPGDQRRRLHLRRREPGGPAVPRVEAERPVRQGEPADGALQV